jgi:hypothetical protein
VKCRPFLVHLTTKSLTLNVKHFLTMSIGKSTRT